MIDAVSKNSLANLVLVDPENPEGRSLVICSDLTHEDDGISVSFLMQQPRLDGDRYKATIKIEEV